MVSNRDNVEIQDPAIKEFKKDRSCIRRSCLTGGGCLFLIFLLLVLIIRFAAVPRPKELKDIPEAFHETIPVYGEQSIEQMTFASGKDQKRALHITTYLPKTFVGPILTTINPELLEQNEQIKKELDGKSTWERITFFSNRDVIIEKDRYEIIWEDLTAEPDFISAFYRSALEEKGFDVTRVRSGRSHSQLSFVKNQIEGSLYIEDDPMETGTSFVSLVVHTPAQ